MVSHDDVSEAGLYEVLVERLKRHFMTGHDDHIILHQWSMDCYHTTTKYMIILWFDETQSSIH